MRHARTIFRFIFIFLFSVTLLYETPTQAEPAENARREVKAGVFHFDGYHSKNDKGGLAGYGVDLLELLSEYSRLNFNLKGYERSWRDMQRDLEDGKIDIVSSARRTPERESKFAFSLPVGRNHTTLAKRLSNTKLRAGDYSTYEGIKIGAVAGSSQNSFLPEFAKDKGFNYTLIELASPRELSEALRAGEVDAILSSNMRKPENETVLDVIKSDNIYVIARKEDQDIIDEINYAIEQMNLNEGDWQSDLFYRHYGPVNSDLSEFSDREKKFIHEKAEDGKPIRALSRGNMPPYSYVEDGILKGILPDYFSQVMSRADLPYTLVAPTDPADYQNKLENDEVEVVIDSLGPPLASEDHVFPGFVTTPYLVTGLARVTRADFNQAPKSVALGETAPLDLRPELLAGIEIKRYPSSREALNAVRKGEADAAYVLPYTAQAYVTNEPGSGLIYSIMESGGAGFRMYVPSSANHELVTILKKAIRTMPPGTLTQLGSNYVSLNAAEMSFTHYLRANPEIWLTGLLALTVGLSLFFITWLRGRWNRRLLATTAHANEELESQLAVVEALSRDYANVLSINPENGCAGIIKIADYGDAEKSARPEDEERYEKIITKYIKQEAHPEDRKYLTKALSLAAVRRQLAVKDEYTGIYRVVDKGVVQYFQFTFVRPRKDGQKEDNLILLGIRNIDELIRREQKQKKDLAEALAQARYASAAKTAFLNNMSHDIRTPMNAIIGFTALASANAENTSLVKRYLGKIMTSGNHLLSLINDVLDMSRIESGKVKIEEKEVSLPEILHDLRTIAQADVKSKQLDFQIDTLDVVNETIYCDRLRLNQILLNILSNAMKYTHPGGKVAVRVSQLTPAEDGAATYEFRISDTGIGMSPEFLKHVFEPFEREQTTTVSGIQGTGLGLAITKNIVDMMGGSINVTSEPDKGSEFTVTFRFRVSENREDLSVPSWLVGARALVVDDDINTCTSLAKFLSQLGLRPDWTTLGKEALVRTEFAREQEEAYSVYLIDWMMADMNGVELTRRLRKTVPPEVPIIILTAYDWSNIEEEGKEAGVTAFCSKPVFLSELKNILVKAETVKEKEEETPSSEVFKDKRVLLAEDNEMNQEIAQMILESAGFVLDIVENGREAVDKIRETEPGYYDLVLMDVQMPVMNGYDATRAIRGLEDGEKARIPIIAMTANAFEEDREEAIKSGMNGYVAKPIDIKKLMATLEEVIKNMRAA